MVLACLLAWLGLGDARAQSLGGFVSPGELASVHEKVSGITGCLACHDLGAGVSATKCLACHDGVRKQVSSKTGFHGDKGQACEKCHPDHRGPSAPLIRLDTNAFDHAKTGFVLHGAHAKERCSSCHTTDGEWTGLSTTCRSCHDDPHGSKVGRPILAECQKCHSDSNWDAVTRIASWFDHTDAAQVDYPLHGQHTKVACEKCHDDWRFVPVKAERCADCHADPHRNQFAPRACDACHTVDRAAFALRDFDHARTDFPLVGPHRQASCESCHGDGTRARYVDLPHQRCETCHQDPHEGQFRPRDCDACHAPTAPSFRLAAFDHDATSFPLRGGHVPVACADCHGKGPGGSFATLQVEGCQSCHADPHEGRLGPAACADCHRDTGWSPVPSFDHARTAFPLTGAHGVVACEACHGPVDRRVLHGLASGSCADCHGDEDPHQDAPATAACSSCHTTDDWVLVAFAHATTGFPLVGKHDGLGCRDCHDDLSFHLPGHACGTCHEPDRPKQHFEGDCGGCHLADGWRPATLGSADHAATGFALKGAHVDVACEGCHDGDATTGSSCIDCHADDDPHRNLLGNTCESCHGPTNWFLIRFTHNTTGWPLRGSHRLAACVDCHATGYVGTPTACRRCHDAEKPNDRLHADPLTSECETCHRPYAWEPARFAHEASP